MNTSENATQKRLNQAQRMWPRLIPAHQMPERMASQRVTAEQDDVDDEDDRAKANPEILVAGVAIEEPHRLVGVAGKDEEEYQRGVEEVPMDVLNHEWKESFAAITPAGLAHRAIGRVRPEALVVRSPIVVAGEPETGGKGKYEKSR